MGISWYVFNISTVSKTSYYSALTLFCLRVFAYQEEDENVSNSEIKKQKMPWKYGLGFPVQGKHQSFIFIPLSYREDTGALRYLFISRLLTVFQFCSWCIFVLLSKEELWYQTVCSRLQHLSKSKQGLSFSHTLQYCMYPRSLVFSAFFRSIAITGPQWHNRMIDSNTKNTLEYPLSLHTTDFTAEL